MRKTIAAMMAQGMSLEDIHNQMEEIFNEEYKKREQEQKEKEIAAARERAIAAMTDYIIAVWDGEPAYPVIYADVAIELDNFAAKFGKDNFTIANSEEADRALMQFLFDMGLIQHVE